MKKTGNGKFVFVHNEDLRKVPESALAVEERLHGGFAVDKRPGEGSTYYGMPGKGLIRISPDLSAQEIIEIPNELRPLNFHSTKIGLFDGKVSLFLPADGDAKVAVLTLEGEIRHVFDTPEFVEYRKEGVAFNPTDTALMGDTLYVADGYGANYISTADLQNRSWSGIFGGKTDDPSELGKYGTAHGLNLTPDSRAFAIADRPHSRIQISSPTGEVSLSHNLPAGSRPCGIDFVRLEGEWFAVVGSLDDPQEGRPAPIYVLDAGYNVVSTLRPKEDLGIERADHIHNVVWHRHDDVTYLICQSWNPGYFFVLQME